MGRATIYIYIYIHMYRNYYHTQNRDIRSCHQRLSSKEKTMHLLVRNQSTTDTAFLFVLQSLVLSIHILAVGSWM